MGSCEIFDWLLNIGRRPSCQPFFCMTVHPCGALTVLAEEGWASHVIHPQRTYESHEWRSWKMCRDLGLIAASSLCSESVFWVFVSLALLQCPVPHLQTIACNGLTTSCNGERYNILPDVTARQMCSAIPHFHCSEEFMLSYTSLKSCMRSLD